MSSSNFLNSSFYLEIRIQPQSAQLLPVRLFLNRIDQLDDAIEAPLAFKILKSNRKINDVNYIRALAKCKRVIKEFIKNQKKSSVIQDIKELLKNDFKNLQEKYITGFALSQKKILYNHIKLFNNRIMKEFNNDLFVGLKAKYV